MHLRMCSATPSVYLDLEKGVLSKTSARKTVVVKATPQVILNKKELQPTYNYNVLTDKTGKYLATVRFLFSPLKIIC